MSGFTIGGSTVGGGSTIGVPNPGPLPGMGAPTLQGFYEFISAVMLVPSTFDPSTSTQVTWAFTFALQWVNTDLAGIPFLYMQAVYNLAADTLIAWQPDPPNAPIYEDGKAYWAYLRAKYQVLAFVPGIIQSTSDEGTSASYLLPESYNGYTIANIQNTKTPYGRTYLGIAQSQGTMWGIT